MKHCNAKVFGAVSIAVALLSVVGRLLTVLFFTDSGTGVHSNASIFPQVFSYLLATVCIGLVVWAFLSKKDFADREAPVSKPFTVFTTAVFGFAMLAYAVILLFSNIAAKSFTAFEIILIVSSFLSGIYYLSLLFARKTSKNMLAILSMVPIVWAITALIEFYFDMTVLISSPSRIWVQITYIAFMIFILAEVRFNIGYESSLLYAPASVIATIFLLSVSVSNLVCSDKMIIGITERPITYAVMLAAGLYSLSKLISFCFISKVVEK